MAHPCCSSRHLVSENCGRPLDFNFEFKGNMSHGLGRQIMHIPTRGVDVYVSMYTFYGFVNVLMTM